MPQIYNNDNQVYSNLIVIQIVKKMIQIVKK